MGQHAAKFGAGTQGPRGAGWVATSAVDGAGVIAVNVIAVRSGVMHCA